MEKKIKVFVDGHSFDNEYQGVRTFIKEIYNILLERYPSLDIFFGATNIDQIHSNFPRAKEENIIHYKNRINVLRFIKDIPAIIRKYQIDFAHFQYLVPFGKKNCIYIVTTHDILFNDFKADFSYAYRSTRNYFFRKGMLEADIKTTVSEYSKERIHHYFGIPVDSIHVIPNGVSPHFGQGFSSNAQAAAYISLRYNISNYILYVSRIEPRKNHIALVKAYIGGGWYEKNISLVFIGKESTPVNELKEYLNGLSAGQKKHIHWISQVEQNDLETFYKGCRVFAYVSKAEGFGIPPLEAAVAGVPVLCSDQTAMKEYDFFKPFLFNPYDVQDLADKLRILLTNAPGNFKPVQTANEVLTRYSWEKSADKLYKLISEYGNHGQSQL